MLFRYLIRMSTAMVERYIDDLVLARGVRDQLEAANVVGLEGCLCPRWGRYDGTRFGGSFSVHNLAFAALCKCGRPRGGRL
jgi:hypothetical protein